jgi:hypothetical protein
MIFSTKNIKPDFAFDFGRYSQTLDATFSSDCKWNKHVDTLIEKTSKQKFKLKLKENILTYVTYKIYLYHLTYVTDNIYLYNLTYVTDKIYMYHLTY